MFRFHAFNPYVEAGRQRLGLTALADFAAALDITQAEALDILSDGSAHNGIPQTALDLAVMLDVTMSQILYVPEDAVDHHRRTLALYAVDMMIAEQSAN